MNFYQIIKRMKHHYPTPKNKKSTKLFWCLTALLLFITPIILAQTPVIAGFENLTYLERDEATPIAPAVTIANGSNYTDSYIEFEIDQATTTETLGVLTQSIPSIVLGEVSIVGSILYLGNGIEAKPIGTVHSIHHGQNGEKLRINFYSALTNAQFTDGFGSDIPGWTVNNTQIYPATPAQHETLFPRTQGNVLVKTGTQSPYTMTRPEHYQYETDANYIVTGQLAEGQSQRGGIVGNSNGTGVPIFSTLIVDEPGATGGRALRLYSNGWVTTPNPNPSRYASAFGPEVYSEAFTAYQGDELALDWRASGSGDDYEVYGYLINTTTAERTLLFYSRGGTKTWTTSSGTIPANGNYQFHFINGSFDRTGGYLIGAEFFIDNIRILSAEGATDAVVTQVARKVTYENTSCTPQINRSITLTARSSSGEIASATNAITITLANCAPVISYILDESTCEGDVMNPIPFTIFDGETNAENLQITATSSNTILLPTANLLIEGTGENRSITLTPISGEDGSTTITLTLTDTEGGITTRSFLCTIAANSLSASAGNTVAVANGDAVIIDNEIEVLTSANVTTTQVQISNGMASGDVLLSLDALPAGVSQTYSPVSGILTFTGSVTSLELQTIFRAVRFQTSSTSNEDRTITFFVQDTPCGSITATKMVEVILSSTPVISNLPSEINNCVQTTDAIAFQITDALIAAEDILLSATSSATSVVPNENIFLSGFGENRTLTVTPLQAGSTTITITATNTFGNTTTASILVTFEDTLAPSIAFLENQIVSTSIGHCSYTHPNTNWNAQVTDNCSATATYILSGATQGSGTTLEGVHFEQGQTTVTWIATDTAGNTSESSFTVEVKDNEMPEIQTIENIVLDDTEGTNIYTHTGTEWDAVYSDNCQASAAYLLSGASAGTGTTLDGVIFRKGITTVTWKAIDTAGNVATTSFTVTLNPLLGINDNQNNFTGITLYPNPATQSVTIDNPSLIAIESITIYDVLGRLVLQENTKETIGNSTINVSTLSAAVYMVILESEGKQLLTRLVKR